MSLRSLIASLPALALALVAIAAILIARAYPMGSLTVMGPGFLPTAVAVLLLLLAVLIAVLALRPRAAAESEEPEPAPLMWRPLLLASVSVLVWALTVDRFGYVPSSALLLLLAFFSMPGTRLTSALLSILFLLVSGYVIFIYLLGMPLPLVGN